jgi:hypothetical protein
MIGVYNGHMVLSLRDCLAKHPPIMLRAIAEGWGISLTDEQVPEIVDRLTDEMTNVETVAMVVQRLNDTEREALAYVEHMGRIKAPLLARRYGPIRPIGPGRLEWEPSWQRPASASERLWFLGLIHRDYGVDAQYHGEVFFIPAEIERVLPRLSASLPMFKVDPTEPPTTLRHDEDALARDAFVILSHLRHHDVRAKKGVLAKHELAQARRRLSDDHLPRLRFLHHTCQQAGLIHREEGVWQPTVQAAEWLKAEPLTRRAALFKAWLEDMDWNDLCLIPGISCEDTGWRNDPVVARQGIVRQLHKCPLETWLTVDSLIESVHEVEPDFMRPDGDYDSWYIRDLTTGHYLMGFRNWNRVEGAYIGYLLESPLLWLGVVALGYTQEPTTVTSFKLTADGAAIVGLGEPIGARESGPTVQDSGPAPIVLRPDLQVFVPREASWYDRFLLERFARWIDEQHGTARYTIDAASVDAALQKGITTRQIKAFLRRASQGRVPGEMMSRLDSWHRADQAPVPRA